MCCCSCKTKAGGRGRSILHFPTGIGSSLLSLRDGSELKAFLFASEEQADSSWFATLMREDEELWFESYEFWYSRKWWFGSYWAAGTSASTRRWRSPQSAVLTWRSSCTAFDRCHDCSRWTVSGYGRRWHTLSHRRGHGLESRRAWRGEAMNMSLSCVRPL